MPKTKRMNDVLVVKPILYGNTSQALGKRAKEGKTHAWTVYVRGLTPEDDLSYIKNVEFQLHSSFAIPNRIVDQAPFEVSEQGWGEFEIIIIIYCKDSSIKPIKLRHPLRLWSTDPNVVSTKKPFCEETYDELLFYEPSEDFYKDLMLNQPFQQNVTPVKSYKLSVQNVVDQYAPIFSEEKELNRVNDAIKKINEQIQEHEERMAKAEQKIREHKEQNKQ
ncbi:YEATS domain-containing protein [Acrasis kona]|uniref:YEATS domain-containing protein n=1 Tax=Acrasis kona TaxID=1008807 RepID=A0AAW2YQD1_9EUKA